MHIPEWEIEELLTNNPELLGFPSNELTLVERQKYLEKTGRYIDLLYKRGNAYLIVEIKATKVDDESVVSEQLIPYRKALAQEYNLTEEQVMCVLVSPNGFTEAVRELCNAAGVMAKTLSQTSLLETVERVSHRSLLTQPKAFSVKIDSADPERNQNIQARQELANLFVRISEKAPIQAHEVGTESNGILRTNRDMWFWLFYSVMDRRANAATFVKARQALEKEKLFAPHKLVQLVETKGERAALNKIATILKDAQFPLLSDHAMKELTFPKSITEAAKFMKKSNYDFTFLYQHYVTAHQNGVSEARDVLWKDLQKEIYGVGPRIASQIVRGLVLKGSWRFPLDDDRYLEKCRFNVWIAGETRLGLVENEIQYCRQLGEFADRFLNGNRGIIAHVLWYLRKKYCNRPPKCLECELSKHCRRAFSFTS